MSLKDIPFRIKEKLYEIVYVHPMSAGCLIGTWTLMGLTGLAASTGNYNAAEPLSSISLFGSIYSGVILSNEYVHSDNDKCFFNPHWRKSKLEEMTKE